jgi:hypothetical protein
MDKPWFKFTPSNWLSGSVQLLDDAEKGTYIDLMAMIWKEGGRLDNNKILHRKLRLDHATACDRIDSYCELEILHCEDDLLSIKFLDSQLDDLADKSKKAKENADKRWSKDKDPMQPHANKKREEEKRRDKKEENIKTHTLETSIDPENCNTGASDIMRYLEVFQKIKSFNFNQEFSKIQGAYAEAIHNCDGGEVQIIQAAKDYLYYCQHMQQATQFRANHISFLNKHQFKTDWLIQAENDFMAKNPKATGGTPMVPQFQERDKLEEELGIKFKWDVE